MEGMLKRLRQWWPFLKALLAVAIVVGVGWLFVRILNNPELQQTDLSRSPGQILWDQFTRARPADLAAGAALYLFGLAFSAVFWLILQHQASEPLPLLTGLRIYFISHLGKYVPVVKGWALLLRVSLSSAAGARAGVAALTTTYEVLTTMAAGALLAAILIGVQLGQDRSPIWPALLLLAVAGIPILPGVFNRLVRGVSVRFNRSGQPLPRLGGRTLLLGLLLTAVGWTMLGASLEATLQALGPERQPWTLGGWMQCTAFVAVSNVAGFVASTPGGLGVREFILQQFLAPQLGPRAVVVVVLLRLLWTAAELGMAGLLYLVPPVRRPVAADVSNPLSGGRQPPEPTALRELTPPLREIEAHPNQDASVKRR